MGKSILTFRNIEIEKSKFYPHQFYPIKKLDG